MFKKGIFTTILLLLFSMANAQTASLAGKVFSVDGPVDNALVQIVGSKAKSFSDSAGNYVIHNLTIGKLKMVVSKDGYNTYANGIELNDSNKNSVNVELTFESNLLQEVVITGTLKAISRQASPVAVEVYKPAYFKKNPTPNIFDALQNVNGVRPQLNCNVCNTGDIHINGMEGPYTMILIDGMPIVSSLSTVYGLSGIPNALIERIEIVKGPASSLYGSEAVGGLINVITKKPSKSASFYADVMSTSWLEHNADLGFTSLVGKNAAVLTGINYFNFQNKRDFNQDNFTDMTLQHRISIFQKWHIERAQNKICNIAARFLNEDRWGGDMRWNKQFRGGDSIYGESIYTKRWEILGNYQLPTKPELLLTFSYNNHGHNSRYGTTSYIAQQNIAFGQLTHSKKIGKNDLLLGTALRYSFYDDNTPATAVTSSNQNNAQKTWLPGIFVQNEFSFAPKQTFLFGLRYDYNSFHGNIITPRFAYKFMLNSQSTLRFNAGTGYRVVNLFTEDHASLTGARIVEIKNQLNPEQSYNANINYLTMILLNTRGFISLDASAFYTHFNNRIVGDYDTDPNKIIYDNLKGFAQSKGLSLNIDFANKKGLKIVAGGTLMENTLTQYGLKSQQILTEKFTGTWAISYRIAKAKLNIDYTGNVYSPMRLPLLSASDPRLPYSPWWSLQNIQFLYNGARNLEIYGGIKNLLNFTPNQGNPFIIARSHDPFDKQVQYNTAGQILATANNPYALSFDPSYMYAPNQGMRVFFGVRINIK